jgi:hypothetical protein
VEGGPGGKWRPRGVKRRWRGGGPVPTVDVRERRRRPPVDEAEDPACGPAGRSGGGAWAAAAVGSAHKNSNAFDLFKGIPEISVMIRLKDGLSELKNFQIKYGCDEIKIRNNFPYWNFSKFGIEFELKFREDSRCLEFE